MPTSNLKIHAPEQPRKRTFSPMSVRQVIEWYQDNHIRAGASQDGEKERRRIRLLFADVHGDRLCEDCAPADLLSFINDNLGASSAWTRRRWAATVNAPFNFAAKARVITSNPFKGIAYPEGEEGRDWTDEEYQTALRHAAPCVRRFIVFMRFSGCRPGEVRNLIWAWLRLDADAILIEQHKNRWRTKRARRVPFNAVLLKLLKWLKRNNRPDAKKIFLNRYGRPWTCKTIDKNIEAIRANAGLPDDFKLHGCRHKFATCAVVNGVDIATLAQLLGHESIATTRRYVHLAGKLPHLNRAMEQAVSGKRG